ncbi:MAG: hypothetical protein EAX86_09450 [Candidatus Heimdallarchaeota archaeon]|nr:hypothetical protein [Candidatus Heimdallarchaeota archaeon]
MAPDLMSARLLDEKYTCFLCFIDFYWVVSRILLHGKWLALSTVIRLLPNGICFELLLRGMTIHAYIFPLLESREITKFFSYQVCEGKNLFNELQY